MRKKPKKETELKIGFATHAHAVIDFDVHYNHMSIMQDWATRFNLVLLGYKGLMAADARELICDMAVQEKCSHVFFLDADHFIPTETLEYLLEMKDESMVSGLITRRFHPFEQVAWAKDDKTNEYISARIPLDGKIYEVGVCAFGCTLINIAKLQKLEKPWFRDTCEIMSNGKRHNMRSDINLCDAFRKNGEKVWIDTRVLIGHEASNLIVYPQNAKDLEVFKFQYTESLKLKTDEQGKYMLPSRML